MQTKHIVDEPYGGRSEWVEGDEEKITKLAEENSAELDKPLTNRGFLLGCSMIAEAMLSISAGDGDDSYEPKESRRALSSAKSVFIEDWRDEADV